MSGVGLRFCRQHTKAINNTVGKHYIIGTRAHRIYQQNYHLSVRNMSFPLGEGSSSAMPPIEGAIRRKIESEYAPVQQYEVVNESYKHNVPKGSESHFKVLVVSEVFEGKTMIQRHRMVNSTLKDELSGNTPDGSKIHALSIQAKTPSQWQTATTTGTAVIQATPNCLGGDKGR